MDTWTVILLCHPNTKMDNGQKIEFTSSRERLPRLQSFKGSVAERHIENLKIMRIFGSKSYAEACGELTLEEIRLRQKVYNLYCGPGKAS